jgi:hypothetical protein
MGRGRLIRPLIIEIEPIDPGGTKAAGGYDPIMQAPIPRRQNAGTVNETRQDGMERRPTIKLKAQVERGPFMALNMEPAGNVASSRVAFVVHRVELEQKGLIREDGSPAFHVGSDRLVATYTILGKLIRRVQDPPGLYLSQVQPAGEGMGGDENLAVLTFEDRKQGSTG